MRRLVPAAALLSCLPLVFGLGLQAVSGQGGQPVGGSVGGSAGGLGGLKKFAARSPAYTVLCTGYAGCGDEGKWNGGYAAVSDTMFWRMYAGHNCTNYAAYRMVHSGLPNVRPWSGPGNAEYWGTSVPDLTDSVPRVGAIAWWRANAGPAGSSGHVAYIQRVVSATEIVVSQDSWGGDFSWAKITDSDGYWPSGFIHFNDVKLRNIKKPTVSGTHKVGATLTAFPGTWKPKGVNFHFHYQWRANGARLAGATDKTFRLTAAQKGKRISVTTRATKLGYPKAYATSVRTTSIAPARARATAGR
jgi:surface antigen